MTGCKNRLGGERCIIGWGKGKKYPPLQKVSLDRLNTTAWHWDFWNLLDTHFKFLTLVLYTKESRHSKAENGFFFKLRPRVTSRTQYSCFQFSHGLKTNKQQRATSLERQYYWWPRLFGIGLQGPKLFNSLNNNIQNASTIPLKTFLLSWFTNLPRRQF